MAVLQMQRISICALKHDRKAILEKLQSMGMIEMHQVAQDEAGFEKMDTQSAKSSFEKRVQITENALDVLSQYTPEKKSMFASLEGNKLIDKKTMEAAAVKQEEVMEVAELLIADHKRIAEAQAEIVKRNAQIEALAPWMSLEVAMNYPGTKKTAMLLGTMAAETTLEMIYGKLAEDHPEIEAVDISVISQDKDAVYLSVFCMKDQAADVENTLRTAGFSRPVVSTEQIPAKQKEELEEQIRQIEQTIADIRGEIISYAEDREELKIIGDYYRMRAEKYEVLGTLPQSRRTFIISGYAAKEAIPAIQKEIGDAYDCVIDVEELKEDEEPQDIFGMSPEDWEDLEGKIGKAIQLAGQLADIWGQFNQIQADKEKKELQEYERSCNRKKELLNKQLNAGKISQEQYNARTSQLDADLEKKKTEIAKKQAKRDKAQSIFSAIISTAAAIAQALPNIPLSIIAGIMGAAQIAVIASQPLPEYAKGGLTDGAKMYIAGEAGQEWISPNWMLKDKTTGPIIQQLEMVRSGILSPEQLAPIRPDFQTMSAIPMYASGGFTSTGSMETNYYTTTTTTNQDNDTLMNINENIKILIEYLSDPRNRQAVISNDLLQKHNEEINMINRLKRL